eukprot:TRINITY_DN15452_c0_g1_i1.p1 TRINITY_DN15452_c0_g1~~TRINITY_DN15452_c0_g1_i1.p1  ORF type:complete len:747 (+),score=297.08 TRINITY_DN15452_c0_g1_i1:326-2242(+)
MHHPADKMGRIKQVETKNFIAGDSKVLLFYVSGCAGMKPNTDRSGYSFSKGFLQMQIRETAKLHDPSMSQSEREEEFISPVSYYGKRVKYNVRELEPLMESASMDMHEWVKLAHEIRENYDRYDGFVILHGADTIPYTAAALSFMLENIGKTVILTGGTIPICEPRTDTLNNLIDAITVAGHFVIPEVCVYCHGKLMRATRTVHTSATCFDMFDSPNAPLLGRAGVSVDLDWRNIRQPTALAPLRTYTALCPDVSILHLFPGISLSAVRALLNPPVKGIILRSFGSGNAPLVRHDILHIFKGATESGIIIVNTTQCTEGAVAAETTRALACVGIVAGGDMTVECALVKLSFLLGSFPDDHAKVSSLMGQDIRGEITVPVATRFTASSDEILSKLSSAIRVSSEGEGEELRDYLNNIVVCNAALNGDLESIKVLVESDAGWQVDVQDYDSRTPLHIAAEHGHHEVAEFLILKGARVHQKDRNGCTPLVQAIMSHKEEAAATIAKAGGALGLLPEKLSQLLTQAVVNKDLLQLELFIKHGADLSIADHNRMTPLSVAVQQGNVDIVKLLLLTGQCDLSARDWWGYTPLETAREASSRTTSPICYVYEAIADLLLQHVPEPSCAFTSAGCDLEITGDTIET